MKIVHVIPTRFPVQGYGGTERVAYWLGKAQAEAGHEVSYLCHAGSSLPFAKTIACPDPVADIDPYLPAGTDFVQLYGTPNFKISAPYLVNIGGNGAAGERFSANTVFVSASHANRHGWTEYVHNGIDISEYPIERTKENYALFLAKTTWRVKNLRGAIKIAQDAAIPLYVAGGRCGFWYRGIKRFGEVGGAQKLALLQKARALLFPVIWEEPFGLAVVEALACGTPVVATARGALPEIIDSSCGILAASHDELVDALNSVSKKISPDACRARVEAKFSHHVMAEKYFSYYQKILRDGKLREGVPKAPMEADPQARTFYQNYQKAWI